MRFRRAANGAKSRGMGELVSMWVGLALILAILVAGRALPTQAHGGGTPQLTDAPAGPYRVFAWTRPDPIRVGMMHVGVAVVKPPEAEASVVSVSDYVLDATVQVEVEPPGRTGEALTGVAIRGDAANKLFYETDIELPKKGQWWVTIAVEGPAGEGSASFKIEVLPATTFNWTLWGGLGLALIVVAWSVRAFWSRNRES